jgi:hypothetical protein
MQFTYSDILSKILTIIDYPQKEKAIREFERLNHLDALMNIFPRLPFEVQNFIKNKQNDPEIIMQYIQQEIYTQELTKVSEEGLITLVDDISSSLNETQREKIAQLISSYENHS